MNWREQTIARILLIIAGMLADEPDLRKQISDLRTHIQVSR